MPQLMPLFWLFSLLVILMVMIVIYNLYLDSLLLLISMDMIKCNSNMLFKWMW